MNDRPTHHLSGDEIAVLKFVAHRQLARWANRRELQPRQRAQRTALIGAIRTLQNNVFAHGCELLAPDGE